MNKERREQKRIKPPAETYVIMDSGDYQIYPVLDISTEGIAFRYVTTEGTSDKSQQLDILIAGKGIGIDGLPCVEVKDFKIEMPQSSLSWEKHRVSLKFKSLCPVKKRELGMFIKKMESARGKGQELEGERPASGPLVV